MLRRFRPGWVLTCAAAWLLLAPPAAAQTAGAPGVDGFALASGPLRIDEHADPRGGVPVHVVAGAPGSIVVRAEVRGVRRLDVHLTRSARDTVATTSGVPDAAGDVAVRLPLPEAGVVYVVQGVAVLEDQRPARSGDSVNGRGERVLPAGAFRVMAEPASRPPTAAMVSAGRPASAAEDARAALLRFVDARLARRGAEVLDLMTEDSRGVEDNSRTMLLQPSNPCWVRSAVEAFGQPTPSTATAVVRVYEHQWMGDVGGTLPQSWEQEVGLVQTPAGWRVGRLGPTGPRRDEPGEPHGPTTSACNVGRRPPVWLAAGLPATGGLPAAALPALGLCGAALATAGAVLQRRR